MSMSVGSAGLEGFALSLGLILALGPQNVFVLRQGLLRSHVFAVCLVCSLADASLIAAGVLGMGSVLSGIEGAEFVIAVAAGAFLTGYGLLRIRSAMSPVGMTTEGEGESDLEAGRATKLLGGPAQPKRKRPKKGEGREAKSRRAKK